MAAWVLVKWAEQLRRELNAIAPKRDKASDGSIGDQSHQSSPSGHNPDESGNAETWDADNKNEVRAVDVDADLRTPGLTAALIVAYLVGRCRAGKEKRLLYIIFNRVIWSASSGWQARAYTGDNPHTSHIHLSGHPNGDEDARPFGLASLLMPKPPAPKPPAPGKPYLRRRWPNLPPGHFFGLITGPTASHGGWVREERADVKAIQQRLQVLGYAPKTAGWADSLFEKPTQDAVAKWQRAKYAKQTTRYGEVWADDWARLFTY